MIACCGCVVVFLGGRAVARACGCGVVFVVATLRFSVLNRYLHIGTYRLLVGNCENSASRFERHASSESFKSNACILEGDPNKIQHRGLT